MNLYLDTSALVKLYVHEAESFAVRRHLKAAVRTATSRLAYPEARAALARRAREGGISERGLRRAVRQLDAQWPRFVVVELDGPLGQTAGELAERHALRGADAVHLASALALEATLGDSVAFLAFDAKLAGAATAAGLLSPP